MTLIQIYAFFVLPAMLAGGGWLYAYAARRALAQKYRNECFKL